MAAAQVVVDKMKVLALLKNAMVYMEVLVS